MSPYTLPDGHVQVAFSGGRTSGMMLHHILEANGGLPDRAEVIFTNTGRERPETLDFVAEVSTRWQVPVTWIEYRLCEPGYGVVGRQGAAEDGEPFAALIRKLGFVPTLRGHGGVMVCSTRLKTRPAVKYLRDKGWRRWTLALGIRADEAHRSSSPGREFWANWRPLVNAGATKRDVTTFWKRKPFDLRLPNIKGVTPQGNCDGCPLKSEAELAALARDYPERAAWWERMEAELAGTTDKPSGSQFMKGQSWRQLRKFVEDQGDWIFNTEGALCQADGGECVG